MWHSINVCERVDVGFDYKFNIIEILDLVENCSAEERQKILNVITSTEVNNDDKVLYINEDADIDINVDIDFHEILDLIDNCSGEEKEEIVESIGINDDNFFVAINLYDEGKVKLLKAAFDKYTLEELQSRLNLR